MTWSFASLRSAIIKRAWQPSSTFRRLKSSRHVLDLQAISIATLALTSIILAVLVLWCGYALGHHGNFGDPDIGILDVVKVAGAVLLISGTILAWVYQTGSKRLGVVDLFACEIMTLCRVGTISALIPRLIGAHKSLSGFGHVYEADAVGQPIGRFTSQEQYFPVFDNNAKDLEVLEADVVSNVTAFYTYMKTFRDYMRRLGDLGADGAANREKADMLVKTIYMLFLAYESARKAIDELIEFEPTNAEAMVTGLVSELDAYRFLTEHFDDNDIRGRRLALREDRYCEFVPQLYETVMSKEGADWEAAQATAIDLERLYNRLNFDPQISPIVPPNMAHTKRPRRSAPSLQVVTAPS
jgi:hypothetical protein